MNKISFLDYFNKTNTTTAGILRKKTQLNEGLKEIKPNVYPNISVPEAACFLTLLPGYSEDIFNSTITLQFDSDEHFRQFDELIINKTAGKQANMREMTDKSVAAKNVTDIPFSSLGIDAQHMDADVLKKYVQDMRTPIFKKMKAAGVQGVNIMFTDGSMQLIGDDPATVARIVGLARRIFSDGTVSKNAVELVGLSQQLNKETDKKGARAAELKQRGVDIMKELNQALNAIQLPESPADEDVATVSDRTKISQAKTVKEYSSGILDVYAVFLMFHLSRQLLEEDPDHEGIGIVSDIIAELSDKLTAVLDKRPDKKDKSYTTAILKAFADHGFINAIRMDGNVSEFHRSMLQLFDKKFQKGLDDKINKQLDFINGQLKQSDLTDDKRKSLELQKKELEFEMTYSGKNVTQMLTDLANDHFAFKVSSYIKQQRQIQSALDGRESDGEDVTAERASYPLITKFKTFNQLMGTVQRTFNRRILKIDDKDTEQQEREARFAAVTYKNIKHTAANPCANRRWKLFEDAQLLGAEVFSNDQWVACVIHNVPQISVFGRNKPKVDRSGKIIAEANLRDDEGITASNKAIRDSKSPHIKDGISSLYDGKPTETRWCVAGGYHYDYNAWDHPNGYWHYSVTDKKTNTGALVAMMQLSSGRLFLFGNEYVLGEYDDRNARFFGDGGKGPDFMERGFANLPGLKSLWEDSGLLERFGFIKKVQPYDAYKRAYEAGHITQNGEFIIKQQSDLTAFKDLLIEASKLIIGVADASYLFKDFTGQLPPIDCSAVTNAEDMFYCANILNEDGLTLMHTENITNMCRMFKQSTLSEIRGLNTRNAHSLDYCFYAMKQKRYQMINIPELDLYSCTTINYAFAYSYVAGIKMKNTDNITSAEDAFIGCSLLTTTPDIRFKRLLSQVHPESMMRSTTNSYRNVDFINVFDGCDSLLNTEDFDRSIEAIEKYYANPRKDKSITDERGFLIIRNEKDANAYYRTFYRFPGVVLDKKCDTLRLFNGLDNIKIRVLDLNGCSKCDKMIYNCQRFFIGKIIGSENVTSASEMFGGSLCYKLPELNFPSLKGEINVFNGMPVFLNSSPLDEKKNVIVTGQYIKPFDTQLDPPEIARKLFGNTANDWINRTAIGQVVGVIYSRNVERYKDLVMAKYKVNDKGEYELQPEDIPNLHIILNIKGLNVLRFSDNLKEEINFNDSQFNQFDGNTNVWQNVNPNTKLPIIDLNGIEHINRLFQNLKCQSIAGFAGYQNVKSMCCTFLCADIKDFSSFPLDMMNNVENTACCFRGFKSNTTIDVNRMNLSNLIDGTEMFFSCSATPKDINIDMPNLKHASNMFTNCSAITQIKRFSAPKCINAFGIFSHSSAIEYVNTINLPETTTLNAIFSECTGLKSIVCINAPKAKDVSSAFFQCPNLKSIHMAYFAEGAGSQQRVFGEPLKYAYGESGEKFFNLCRRLKARGKTS